MATIQGIYVALFGRPADPLGLEYFNNVTNNGADLTAIGDLAATAEYQDRFEGMNNAQIVTAIYQSLFGRNPELAGLEFFVNALNNGTLNINNVAIAILDGAQGDDAALVEAKIAAADQFTAAVAADSDALARYQGETGADFGRSFLSQIADADDEFTDAQVAAQVAAFGDNNPDTGIPGTPGAILTLTAGADVVDPSASGLQFKSTANDDNIRAIAADSLNSSDVINGGAGFDTLNISLNAVDNAAGASAPVISNVERINNSDGGSALNLASVSGLQQLWSNANDTATFTYTNASTATVFGTSGLAAGETHTIEVDLAGALTGRTTVNIATSNAGGDAVFDFDADSAGIEAVSINAASGAGEVSLDAIAMTKLDTITVTGAGRITVDAPVTSLTTFDASGNTGGVLYTSGVLTKDATITSGSGNDVLDLDAAATDLTISTGAGHDRVWLGAGDNTVNVGAGNDIVTISATGGRNEITLGDGNDTFVLGAADSSSYTATEDGYSTITDFGTSDKIDLSNVPAGVAWALLTGSDQIDVEDAVAAAAALPGATLADVVAAVDGVTNADDVTVFEYAGNTYVFADTGADAVLVELTGSVSLGASNFILA